MESTAVLRRFNRTYTQRIGALEESFLGLGMPLASARLLFEIGSAGPVTVQQLRARLDLDSGYLSRMLRSLERDGLVAVEPDAADRRVRRARLTAAGRAERALIDRASDELAERMLAPLRERQRERLVAAMGDVERLLSATMVEIAVTDPEHPHARHCLHAYAVELDRRFSAGFDPGHSTLPDPTKLRPPEGLLLVATLYGEPVGCGALRVYGEDATDIKRMWVAENARGLGLGRRLLAELEARVQTPVVRLETNRALTEAIAMYRSAGYVEVPAFNAEPYGDHWFEKRLT
jgi:DNA-binding MarR family transcriptional regulator